MGKINFRELAVKAAKIAEDKKALNTVVLDVEPLTSMANFFVITSAQSTPQINAVCNEIEKSFKEESITPIRREGVSSQSWRVIDYGGIVIHVMSERIRETYNLEKLWSGAKTVKYKDSAILKISDSQKVKELEKNVEKVLNAGGKKAAEISKKVKKQVEKNLKIGGKKAKAAVKTAEKASKKAKKELKKNLKAGKKQVKEAEKTVMKVSKEVKKTIKEKVKDVKKVAFAVGKGIEAFKKTLLKEELKKKKQTKGKPKKNR